MDRTPAEVFSPGEIVKEELDARGWSQTDLAEILGRPFQLVNEIISGKRTITPETAKGLGDAFGTGAQFWLNLETAHQLSKVKSDDTVSRRSKLYSKAPVKEMIKRRWIAPSPSIDVLEKEVLKFFEIKELDEEIKFWPHAARKSTAESTLSPAQQAWLYRAKHLAKAVHAKSFAASLIEECITRLRLLLAAPEEIRQVPRILADTGIRFLIIEPLPRTRIDGVCFWLDDRSPVIALSFRYDRIDWFWFTLLHEIGHVRNKDGLGQDGHLDVDLVGDAAVPTTQKPEKEKRADIFAEESLIPKKEIESFRARVSPLYSKQKIWGFAAKLQIHAGIVVGQLQRRGEISYAHNREMLIKVRNIITPSVLADGWGNEIVLNS
jgi:HTH-type transcriptional regulator/antitoxin HigA